MQPVNLSNREKGCPVSSYVEAGGEVLLSSSRSKARATLLFNTKSTYKGPVDESAIAALNKRCGAGKRTCAYTLPAPADYIKRITVASEKEVPLTNLAPYRDLLCRDQHSHYVRVKPRYEPFVRHHQNAQYFAVRTPERDADHAALRSDRQEVHASWQAV